MVELFWFPSPDKNPGVKGIQGRFERLGVIAQILRSPTDRERYDVSVSSPHRRKPNSTKGHGDNARLVFQQERCTDLARYGVLLLPFPSDSPAYAFLPRRSFLGLPLPRHEVELCSR